MGAAETQQVIFVELTLINYSLVDARGGAMQQNRYIASPFPAGIPLRHTSEFEVISFQSISSSGNGPCRSPPFYR